MLERFTELLNDYHSRCLTQNHEEKKVTLPYKPEVKIELTDWRGMGSITRPFQIERVTNSIVYRAGDRVSPDTVDAMIKDYGWTVVVRRVVEGDVLQPV